MHGFIPLLFEWESVKTEEKGLDTLMRPKSAAMGKTEFAVHNTLCLIETTHANIHKIRTLTHNTMFIRPVKNTMRKRHILFRRMSH